MATFMVKFAQALGSVLAGSWLGWLAVSAEQTLAQTPIPSSQRSSVPIHQALPASQLPNVQPTDWSYRALISLAERYACIHLGPYPIVERPVSRYEIAAGVRACLEKVPESVAILTNFTEQDTLLSPQGLQEDLSILQRLEKEFSPELTLFSERAIVLARLEAMKRLIILQQSITQSPDVQRIVQPTDWSYRAVTELVRNYRCGFGHYLGIPFVQQRPKSRHNLAIRINACLGYIKAIDSQEDLATLQVLQDEFSTSLAILADVQSVYQRLNELDRLEDLWWDARLLTVMQKPAPHRPTVQLTDWSYRALESLAENYPYCVGSYFGWGLGERPLSRYQIAGGVNNCHSYIAKLVAQADKNFVSQNDLAMLQHLQEEFESEIATIREYGRVRERLVTLTEYQVQPPTVQPTDTEYSLLKSLAESYGCIMRNPDSFVIKRPLSRYKMATEVNACFSYVADLNARGSDHVSQNDLMTLQSLQDKFKTELAILAEETIVRKRLHALRTMIYAY